MAEVKEILDLIEGRISKKYEALIVHAYDFAKKAHEGQKRANGDPYFVHVFETAKTLARLGMDAHTVAAGFLHDVLEDTNVEEKELEDEFCKEMVFLVNGVTKL